MRWCLFPPRSCRKSKKSRKSTKTSRRSWTRNNSKRRRRQIVSEGEALEKQGKLAEAIDKYVDAEGIFSTHDALNGIKRIHEAEDQKVAAALTSTHHTYDQANYQACTAQLEEALKVEPSNPPVHYDLALCYSKLADRPRALDHLDQSTSMVTKTKLRMELLELHSQLLMGTDLAADPPPEIGEEAGELQ